MLNNVNEIILKLEKSIYDAENNISNINDDIINIPSMSGFKIKHLLNNIGSIYNYDYLEVGTWKGGTLSSVLYNNNLNNCYCIDNFSELTDIWNNGNSIKDELLKNIQLYKGDNSVIFFEDDFFLFDFSKLKKINLFLYDGNHDYESHFSNLNLMFDSLDDYFIYLVDDIQFEKVKNGLMNSLSSLIENKKIEILYQKFIDENSLPSNNINNWWNGYSINYIKKLK